MRSKGAPRTSDLIHDALRGRDRPLGAYAIADGLTAATGRKSYANTIYRAIVPLETAGEVLRVVSLKGWIKTDPAGGPMIVLVCKGCATTQMLAGSPAFAMVQDACLANGFAPARINIEIIGRCPACDSDAASR